MDILMPNSTGNDIINYDTTTIICSIIREYILCILLYYFSWIFVVVFLDAPDPYSRLFSRKTSSS